MNKLYTIVATILGFVILAPMLITWIVIMFTMMIEIFTGVNIIDSFIKPFFQGLL